MFKGFINVNILSQYKLIIIVNIVWCHNIMYHTSFQCFYEKTGKISSIIDK